MANPVALDLKVQWNEDYYAEYQLLDDFTGEPISLAGCTVSMQVRVAAGVGGAPPITASCAVVDTTNGIWSEAISKAQLLQASGSQNVFRWAYDVLIVDDLASTKAWRRGAFIIEPGVTQ